MKEIERKYDFKKMTERKFNNLVDNYEEALNNLREQYADIDNKYEMKLREQEVKYRKEISELLDVKTALENEIKRLNDKCLQLREVFIKGVLD